jgi:Meiotically up-regulated gene 113
MSEHESTTFETLQRLNTQLRAELMVLPELTDEELLLVKYVRPHLSLPAMFLWIDRCQQQTPSPVKLKSHYIYVLQNTTTRHVKIGYTTKPQQRLSRLRCTTADDLLLIGLWQVPARKIELELHECFDDVRVGHSRSEWFGLTEPDIDILIGLMMDFERLR